MTSNLSNIPEEKMAMLLTVFADIKLPEIDEVCDRCWHHRKVIIWHAQSV